VRSVKEYKLQCLPRLENYKEVTVEDANNFERKDREFEGVFAKTIDQVLYGVKPDSKVS
jgi:hypothetical protein